MTVVSLVICDKVTDEYGSTCANRSLPSRKAAEEAARDWEAEGWLIGRDRSLCPDHSGAGRSKRRR